ncbi:hypothetical protein [Microbacterium sp. No. 7]|uniref:hypothetical protein n=1 Tax=Microbacterium sp. No. 7 TaxID=1714373 RepID=UPI0006CF32BF|nr:hypothetical protein [Microbacterium sp. No. 7]ALJ20641.1 hypothetical protein AOA12_12320 [Microbacterium sp. No. 7]
MSRAVVEQLFRPGGAGPMVYGIHVTDGGFAVGDIVRGPDGDMAQITKVGPAMGSRFPVHLSPVIALREGDEIERLNR